MRISLLLLSLSLLISSSVFSQWESGHICYVKDLDGTYREHNVDMKSLVLEVAFQPELGVVNGKATYVFQPLQKDVDSLYLDGPDINISSVNFSDGLVSHKAINEEGIAFYFKKPLDWQQDYTLEINYTAHPDKGIYFIGWNDPTERARKQIWTQGQGIDNRHWIPGYDNMNDKLVTETIITFDSEYEVVSNGILEKQIENTDGTTTWHYAMDKPHSLYLVMIAIGIYDYIEYTSDNGVVSRQYYYPDQAETAEPTYQYSAEMMDYLEAEFGVPYPWPIYRNVPVQDFMYGAMENTTSTILTDYYMQDERGVLERNYIGTNAHELTHQWFGDYVTEWSATHHWLHESFATHYAKHFRAYIFGEDEYQWIRRQELERTWEANLQDQLPIAHSKAGSSRHYPKGSLVIDMLRYVVGEEQYKKALKHFLEKHPYDMVDTHDFFQAFMESLGMNIQWFLDEWIYRGGEPHYVVGYEAGDISTTITVQQKHEVNDLVGYFRMPIVFQVWYKDGSMSEVKEWVDGPITTVSVPNEKSKAIDFVLFDPNWNVVKTVDFYKETPELLAQAQKAPNMIDRYDAILALVDEYWDKEEEIAEELVEIYYNESYHMTKGAIVEFLADHTYLKSVEKMIKDAIKDDDHLVRRATLNGVTEITDKMMTDYEKLLKDKSYVNVESALISLCNSFPQNKQRYLEITKDEVGMNKNIRIAWLALAIEDVNSPYLEELVDYAGPSYEFRTRVYAIEVLQQLQYCNEDLVSYLIDGALSFNRRLYNPATSALQDIATMRACNTYYLDYLNNGNLSDEEQETLRNKIY